MKFKTCESRPGETVQWLRALAALPEDLSSVIHTHTHTHTHTLQAAHTHLLSSWRGSIALFWSL